MSEYLELYKKYRPKTWEDLIGQEKVAKSLRAAVVSDKIPTAYLFAGERGTGKTSAAKILAKAINCENRSESGNPCNQCETCASIDENSQLGVSYVSMANNGSVDSVRQIVQDSRLAQPVNKKVVILDEVHNISRAAFDSLLIPLEETNNNTLFILCSTEIKKIPATIKSRVQPRSFSLLTSEKLTQLLTTISQKENVGSQSGIEKAVKRARGSARDAITYFESDLSGTADLSYTNRILTGIYRHNIISILMDIAEADASDVPLDELTEDIISDLRTIILRCEGASEELAGVSPVEDELEFVRGVFNTQSVLYLMKSLTQAYSTMVAGGSPRPLLEMVLIEYVSILKKKQAAKKTNADA